MKRINYNVQESCHKLLKLAALYKEQTLQEFCAVAGYNHLLNLAKEDDRLLELLVNVDVPPDALAGQLQQELRSFNE